MQLVTVNENDIGNTEILHQESSRSTNSAAAYLPPMIMTIALTATMATFLTILMAQKLISCSCLESFTVKLIRRGMGRAQFDEIVQQESSTV